MAKGLFRFKSQLDGDLAQIQLLVKHPMEPGHRRDKKTGSPVAPNFLTQIQVFHDEEMVFAADLSAGIASNPYLAFAFSGALEGEEILIYWQDNSGNEGVEKGVLRF